MARNYDEKRVAGKYGEERKEMVEKLKDSDLNPRCPFLAVLHGISAKMMIK